MHRARGKGVAWLGVGALIAALLAGACADYRSNAREWDRENARHAGDPPSHPGPRNPGDLEFP